MSATTAARPATWRAVSASCKGSAHAAGVPNQDAVRAEQVATPDGDVWVVGVADGHGGARYVRSDEGARVAVALAVDHVAEDLRRGADPVGVLREAVPGVVTAWRAQVAAHERDHPFTPDELARGAVPGSTAYGATLLVAVIGAHGVSLAQVGDSDALVRSHGFATRPVPGDDRLVAGETTSLCLDTAVDDFRYTHVPASAEPDLVLLATDGYGNSFAQADWWHGLVDDVAGLVVRSGFDLVADQLPSWLEESARVGGDDVSAVLLVREPLTGDVVAPLPRTRELAGTTEGAPEPAAAGTAPPRRRRAAWVAVLAVAVVVLAVVLTVRALGSAADPPSTPVEPSGTTPVVDGSTSTSPTGPASGRREPGTGKKDRGRKPPGGVEQRPGDAPVPGTDDGKDTPAPEQG